MPSLIETISRQRPAPAVLVAEGRLIGLRAPEPKRLKHPSSGFYSRLRRRCPIDNLGGHAEIRNLPAEPFDPFPLTRQCLPPTMLANNTAPCVVFPSMIGNKAGSCPRRSRCTGAAAALAQLMRRSAPRALPAREEAGVVIHTWSLARTRATLTWILALKRKAAAHVHNGNAKDKETLL